MTIFCVKKITPNTRLGNKLRSAREAKGLTLKELGARMRLSVKYLQAIENGAFNLLPKAKAYRLAYIKNFAAILGLNQNNCVAQMIREAGLIDAAPVHPHRNIKWFPFTSLSIAIRNAIFVFCILIFAGYLIWQVRGVLEPPKLNLYLPIEGEIANALNATIQGETEPEATLKVNGKDIMLNDRGRFETKIDLSEGVNTITVTAIKKHGKTTTITRHIVVRPQKKADQLSLK